MLLTVRRVGSHWGSGSERRNSPMSEENKSMARLYWEEAINKGNLDILDEVYNPDSVIHDPASDSGS
jgi:hypothetical protein